MSKRKKIMKRIYIGLGAVIFQLLYLADVQAGTNTPTKENANAYINTYAFVVSTTESCLKVLPRAIAQAQNVIQALDFRLKTDPGFAGFDKDSPETKAAIIETRKQMDEHLAKLQSNVDKLNDYISNSEMKRYKNDCEEVFRNGYFGKYFRNVRMVRNLISSQTILPTVYQENFLSSPYESDFSAWQIAFSYDFIELLYKIENDGSAVKSLLSGKDVAALKTLFAHSVANGEKGLDFKRMIISNMFVRNQGGGLKLRFSSTMQLAIVTMMGTRKMI